MATITIRLSESDKELFTNVSKEKNKTLSDWARESLLEKIEEEYDEKIIKDYLLNKDSMKFYTSEEVKNELGL
ncbi:MAG: type II toxin-antitoxin system RelB family antitoxin [Finegoldia sp.]|uniref:type II toxin-antitoxin system RelB family antitoxin n=1 Tax=Finegoldia sp. TaxID=1981334 RepID=UPI003991055C